MSKVYTTPVSNALKELSFLVFGRDCGSDFQETINTVEKVALMYPNINFQLVVVDDASERRVTLEIDNNLFEYVDRIYLSKSVGICGAIINGLKYIKYTKMIWLPASNMYGAKAICNLIDFSGSSDLALGYRSNLTKHRPPIKLFASLLVRGIMHLSTFHFVADFKACNLYRTEDVKQWLSPENSHGGDLVLLVQILLRTEKIVQVATPINISHNKRASKKFSDNWPSHRAIFSAVKGVLESIRIYRSWNKKIKKEEL